jgi:hypothetical protein
MTPTILNPNATPSDRLFLAIRAIETALDEMEALRTEGARIPPRWLQELEACQYRLDGVVIDGKRARSMIHLTSEHGRAP